MYETKFKVKLSDQVVECETFTLERYVKFLMSRGSDKSELIKKWMHEVLSECTNATKLAKHDAELLIINLIGRSINQDEITQDYVCECGTEFPVKLDLSRATIDFNEASTETLYVFKNFKLSFNWPELFDDDNVPLMIVKAMDSIYVGDECIEVDDLNMQELDDLHSAITPNDINSIKQFLLAPKVQLAVPVSCPICGKKHVHVIEGFNEFIRILQ
jgi:hypothetical protein